jgi:toxin YoeB
MKSQERPVYLLIVDPNFIEDLRYWTDPHAKTASKILELVETIRRDPFKGIGKPEPLKSLGAGIWSRRITQEHRIVYRIDNGRIYFLQCRYHY